MAQKTKIIAGNRGFCSEPDTQAYFVPVYDANGVQPNLLGCDVFFDEHGNVTKIVGWEDGSLGLLEHGDVMGAEVIALAKVRWAEARKRSEVQNGN